MAFEDLVIEPDVARSIVETALGGDPGVLTRAESMSANQVFLGEHVVVKMVHVDAYSGLHREIALVPMLPAGITAPLLASGEHEDLRYACFVRMPGASPGLYLPHTGAATARKLAAQALECLDRLHAWQPDPDSMATLTTEQYHGGFTGRAAFQEEIERLAQVDRDGVVPAQLIKGLEEIAQRAPDRLQRAVPVHGDCDWQNWLADGDTITALLDFESARLAEPVDDWFFLIRTGGPHMTAVLDVVTEHTTIAEDELRAACEMRHASYVISDVRLRLQGLHVGVGSVNELVEIIDDRFWWSERRGASARGEDELDVRRAGEVMSVHENPLLLVRRLEPSDVELVASIDRSEHVDVHYRVEDGRLIGEPVPDRMAVIPPWDPDGTGEGSVAKQVGFYASVVADGAVLFGAFDGDEVMGLASVHPTFQPGLAWLATLHVSQPHRRRGAASALWEACVSVAREAGAQSLYVSATRTGSAVGFYLSRGCRLADPVHPGLFADEPEDIHLVCALDG